jgi:hypothetical protein
VFAGHTAKQSATIHTPSPQLSRPVSRALREITALFHDVQRSGDPETSWAIGRIGPHLEGKATDGRDIASVWDEAIRKARELSISPRRGCR